MKSAAPKQKRAEGFETQWEFCLYIAGQTPRSLAARDNLQQLCELHLKGHYRIEVIDLLDNPVLARDDNIFAVPTLVCRRPAPPRTIIGDLSDTERVLARLCITPGQVKD